MWLRESNTEETELSHWQSFLEEIDNTDLPRYNLRIQTNDASIWYDTIHRMKSHSSPGVCGWRSEELKLLPFVAVKHLCDIFQRIWPEGLSSNMMKSRTVLLEKVVSPKGMGDTRPITILSVLARLASKVIADQALTQLASQVPPEISGGMPKRGVRDLSLDQHFKIEKAIHSQDDFGGFTLDLVKAFNCIPRAPLRELFVRIGFDSNVIDYWFKSLAKLTRFPQCMGSLGTPMRSTSGIPEGDSCSVLGMVVLSIFYYHRIKTEHLNPYTYADNWSWLTSCEKDHFVALVKVMNLVQSLKMEIDFTKSWAWGVTRHFRKAIQNCNLLFPNGQINIDTLTTVKDLGAQLHYNRHVTLGSINKRIQEGIKRCDRIRWVPMDIKSKAKFVQSAVWPTALYSATTQMIGQKHWQSLRRAVARALLSDHNYASAFVACSCYVPGLQDPLLYALNLIFCNFRRLVDINRACAIEFWQFASNFRRTAFGPAGALAKYANKCGWELGQQGKLKGPGGISLDLFVHSPKEISAICNDACSYYVYDNIKHRRGITASSIDAALTAKVVQTLAPSEQNLIAMNISGGFQSGTTKCKWAYGVDEFCQFCGQIDSKWHGIVECPEMLAPRLKHKHAVKVLQKYRPEWVDLPIARRHVDVPFLNMIHDSWTEPTLDDFELHCEPGVTPPGQHLVFYTDGACKYPAIKHAKYASWVVIQDLSYDAQQQIDILESLPTWPDENNSLFVCATGLVVGKQSPARAELTAVVLTTEKVALSHPLTTMVIHTDAQYGCDVIKTIQNSDSVPLTYHLSNFDLVCRLAKVWDKDRFRIEKIKAHQNPNGITDPIQKWKVLGNHVADRTASKALQVCSNVVQTTHSEVAVFCEQEYLRLRQVLMYYVDLNTFRMNLLKKKEKEKTALRCQNVSQVSVLNDGNLDNLVVANPDSFHDALNHLTLWQPYSFDQCFKNDIPNDILSAMSVGASFTHLACKWLALLQWPPLEDFDIDITQDSGISFFELLVNMMVCTGNLMPIPLCPGERYTDYCLYPSDQEALLPISQKTVNCQVHAFEKFIRQLENLAGCTVIPPYPKNVKQPCKSLLRLGFHPKAAGVSRRPVIPKAKETMKIVSEYLDVARRRGSLDKPLTLGVSDNPLVELLQISEIPPKERYNYAQVVRKRRAKLN